MRVVIEKQLDQPPERLFAILSQPRDRPLWQRATRSVEAPGDGPVAVGTRWTEVNAELGTYEVRVAALEPGRLWVEEAAPRHVPASIRVALAPAGDAGTAVTVTVEAALRGHRRLMEPIIAPMMRREMERDLERLERLAATRAGTAP